MRNDYVVTCEGEEHKLLVEDGKIRIQHDLKRELAVFLLGADPCACLAAGLYLEWLSYFDWDDRSLLYLNRERWRESGALSRYHRSSGWTQGIRIVRESRQIWSGMFLRLEGR